MGRSTWKQKVSNDQRLLLLKEDGYDISGLLKRGTTADDIIDVIFKHVESRNNSKIAIPAANPCPSPSMDNAFDEEAGHCYKSPAGIEEKALVGTQLSHGQKNVRAYWIANGRIPKKQDRATIVLATAAGLKRKRPDEDEKQPDCLSENHCIADIKLSFSGQDVQISSHIGSVLRCSCDPVRKKLRRQDPLDVAREENRAAISKRKKNTLTDIFRLSRASRLLSSGVNQERHHVHFSSVIFTRSVPLPQSDHCNAIYMSSRGLKFIFDELRYLSSDENGDDSFTVRDAEHTEFLIEVSQLQNGTIGISGETPTLIGLLSRLKDHKLLHTSEFMISPAELCWKQIGEAGSLSTETQDELTCIIDELGAADKRRGISLTVFQYQPTGVKYIFA